MAKKKYYGSKATKKRYAKASKMYDGPYSGMDQRRRTEGQDSGMIREDPSAIANLPQDVRYHSWPEPTRYAKYYLDDTIKGVNHQMDDDSDEMKKMMFPEKY